MTTTTLEQALEQACKEPTLIDALSFIAIWESERAIKQALEWQKTGVRAGVITNGEAAAWDTCFKYCFEALEKKWGQRELWKPNDS